MSASYAPFNEPQASVAPERSGKVRALTALLAGFGLGCGAMYVSGGQPMPSDAINMAWAPPAQSSRFMPPTLPRYPVQPAGLRMQPVAASTPRESDAPMQGRREFMTGLGLAAAGALLKDGAANAEYGDGANVFGKSTNPSGFLAYAGEGYSVLLPSRWKSRSERDFPDEVFAYEDNFDQVNYLAVIKGKGGIGSSPLDFMNKYSYLLGKQSYDGESISEGGFAPNRVSAASVLGATEETDKKGRKVYNVEVLTRTADGNEGGRHQVFKALESGGYTYILKVQMGDKRWFGGQKKYAEGILQSFTVA